LLCSIYNYKNKGICYDDRPGDGKHNPVNDKY
jgi:hypothetical protein